MYQATQQQVVKPRRVALKLHHSCLGQFVILWSMYDRPCDFNVQKSKQSPEFLGICFNVENNDTVDLLRAVPEEIRGTEIIDL